MLIIIIIIICFVKTFHLSSFTGKTSSQNIKKSSCYLSKLIENSFKERQLGVLHLPTEGIEHATQGFGPFVRIKKLRSSKSGPGFPGQRSRSRRTAQLRFCPRTPQQVDEEGQQRRKRWKRDTNGEKV